MTIARTLVKADRILERLKAAQPVDPFVSFSTEQRHYYDQWWDQFKAQFSARPDGLYEAAINYTMWTPSDWLACSRISKDMTIQDAQQVYANQLGKRQ